ncbi:M15 family metallopeptidase [Amycolatopsis minnesotensis]|uniref:M15 family metallopeptidase n=1 Tax=Amycolatopsis minnesotensis TaxID=337894 RepID=A0ABP5E574_9PSEU
MRTLKLGTVAAAVFLLTACGGDPAPVTAPPPPVAPVTTTSARPSTTSRPPTTSSAAPAAAWVVGAHPLPRRSDGYGEIQPTPSVLVNRSLPTKDILPPPVGGKYAATTSPVPANVLARSTWQAACPVAAEDLAYLTMSFWGFDGKPHTGEMIVNASVADAVTKVFGQLYANRFPFEEMRVTSAPELDAAPTGDGNDTSAFVCRPTRGQKNWSAHASGLAIDLNPFCNPYVKGEIVVPELASAYKNRAAARPGMVLPGDATVRAFTAIGWTWGGSWNSPKDIMHFSATGG